MLTHGEAAHCVSAWVAALFNQPVVWIGFPPIYIGRKGVSLCVYIWRFQHWQCSRTTCLQKRHPLNSNSFRYTWIIYRGWPPLTLDVSYCKIYGLILNIFHLCTKNCHSLLIIHEHLCFPHLPGFIVNERNGREQRKWKRIGGGWKERKWDTGRKRKWKT